MHSDYSVLAPFINIVVALLCVFVLVSVILFWRMFTRLEKKVDDIKDWIQNSTEKCGDCRLELEVKIKECLKEDNFKTFMIRRDNDWKEWWETFNKHVHDTKTGRAVRG